MRLRFVILGVILTAGVAALILRAGISNSSVHSSTGSDSLNESKEEYVWTKTKLKLDEWPVSLICGPYDTLFIGTRSRTILRGEPGGESWEESSDGIKECWIKSMTADSKGRIYAGTGRGIYRSTDGGHSWSLFNQGLTNLGVQSLVIGPKGEVYAGTRGGVFRLDTDKERWLPVVPSLPYQDAGPDALAVDSRGSIYVVISNELYRSSKESKEWIPVEFSEKQYLNCIFVDSKDSIYVGLSPTSWNAAELRSEWTGNPSLLKSKDGKEWKALTLSEEPLIVHDLDEGPGGIIAAATNLGPFVSLDGGDTWQALIPNLFEKVHHPLSLPGGYSDRSCLVKFDSIGRIYYLYRAKKWIWCGSPTVDPRKP